jgi:hypothetical protein
MPVSDDEFRPSPEYWASLIVAILRHYGQTSVTITQAELQATAVLGMTLHAIDNTTVEISVVQNHDAPEVVETFVGLDYASAHLPDPKKLN